MTLHEAIEIADKMKPNDFDNAVKTAWINEIELKIQTETFLHHNHNYTHVYEDTLTLEPVTFNEDTITTSHHLNARAFGTLTIIGSDYAGEYKVKRVDGNNITVIDGDFDETEAIVTISYSGKDVELILPTEYDSVYYMTLAAKIDFAQGDYDKYQNTMNMANEKWLDFNKWFCTHFIDERRPLYRGHRYFPNWLFTETVITDRDIERIWSEMICRRS